METLPTGEIFNFVPDRGKFETVPYPIRGYFATAPPPPLLAFPYSDILIGPLFPRKRERETEAEKDEA